MYNIILAVMTWLVKQKSCSCEPWSDVQGMSRRRTAGCMKLAERCVGMKTMVLPKTMVERREQSRLGELSSWNIAGSNHWSLQDVLAARAFISLRTVDRPLWPKRPVTVTDCFLLRFSLKVNQAYFIFHVAMSLYNIKEKQHTQDD